MNQERISMEIKLPTDCGNSPRIAIVGDFVANWAEGNTEPLSEWLTDEATWTVIGGSSERGLGATHAAAPPFVADRLEVFAIITHGRLASCDGYLAAGDRRLNFNHSFRFAGAVKTSRIAELRSYYIATAGDS